MKATTNMPKTASLFLSRRFHASRHSEVPFAGADAPEVRTSPSPTAVSGKACISSPLRDATGALGGVPRGVSAGSPAAHGSCGSERPSSVGTFGVLSSLISSVAYARIDEAVGDIDQKVEDQHEDRRERDDAEDERLVAVQVRVDEVGA